MLEQMQRRDDFTHHPEREQLHLGGVVLIAPSGPVRTALRNGVVVFASVACAEPDEGSKFSLQLLSGEEGKCTRGLGEMCWVTHIYQHLRRSWNGT